MKPITDSEKKLIYTGLMIEQEAPKGDDLTFFHSIMCQVGLPRSKQSCLEFKRICGNAAIHLRAGNIWDGKDYVQQDLPYGAVPRLILSWLNASALRNNTKEIQLGSSMSEFMRYLGLGKTGGTTGTINSFKKQMKALSVCNITLGYTINDVATTYDGKPIQQFEGFDVQRNEN